MFRQRAALWVGLLIAVVAAGAYRWYALREPPTTPVTIAFVTGGKDGYWLMTINGARAAAQHDGVNLRLETPAENENVAQQTEILSKLDPAQLDGVALSPLDADGQTELINNIADKTKVVTFDSDAPDARRLSYIGTSNFSAGRTCARLVSEALPQGGKIVVLLANLTKDNLRDRKGGFQERIDAYADDVEPGATGPKYVVVDYLTDNGNPEKCAENVRAALDKTADLNGLVAMNAFQGPVILRTLKDAGKLGQIKLVTFDVADETLDGIEAGHIFATVAQDPYQFGYQAVTTLADFARGDSVRVPIVGKGTVSVSAEPIYQKNLDDFRSRLKAQSAPKEVAAKK